MVSLDRYRGCLLGLAVGDALGTTVEFAPRGSFPPLTDVVGGGPFHLQPGQWTDDTAMALCLASSLVAVPGFDALDQMRRYLAWYEEGYLSSTGFCFDIGNTTRQALLAFKHSGDPWSGSSHPRNAGNGSIMRLAPVPMFYCAEPEQALHWAAESSRTTHGAQECLEACRLLAAILIRALRGGDKAEVLFGDIPPGITTAAIHRIAQGAYRQSVAAEIRGTGYVVSSLEAALWCFWQSNSFSEAVVQAANLGEDADTTAAICGQVAGAYYGEGGIPAAWLAVLAHKNVITNLAEGLFHHSQVR